MAGRLKICLHRFFTIYSHFFQTARIKRKPCCEIGNALLYSRTPLLQTQGSLRRLSRRSKRHINPEVSRNIISLSCEDAHTHEQDQYRLNHCQLSEDHRYPKPRSMNVPIAFRSRSHSHPYFSEATPQTEEPHVAVLPATVSAVLLF